MLSFVLSSGLTGVYALGQKKPILFIHGMWEGAWVFENWMQYASENGHAVYAPNLRGHHSSKSCDIGKVTMKDYIQDVLDVIDFIGECPIVVGHSLGGLIAQVVAAQGCVQRAVFVTSAPSSEVWLQGPVIRTLSSSVDYLKCVLFGKALMIQYDHARMLELNNFSDIEAMVLYKRMVPESGTVAREILTLQISVPEVRCQSMVISGEKDRMTVPEIQVKIAKRLGSVLKTYPNGHMIMIEDGWEEPIRDILRFIV